MKILSICGIIPIPDLKKENDVVFHTYDYYLEKYPDNEIDFILPVPYSNFLLSKFNDKQFRRYKLNNIEGYTDRGYDITIFPHLIFLINLNQYTLMQKLLYYQNISKIKKFRDHDLIHAHRIFPEGYLAYKMSQRLNIPYVLTVRKEERYFDGGKVEERATEIIDHAAQVTTPTAYSYRLLKSRYPDLHLVPHGIEERFFVDKIKNKEGPVKILTVARLLELKNIEFVISTLARMKDEYAFKYVIVGEGPHRETIEACIAEHQMQEHVEMKSHVPHDEIQREYAEADIFVLTSLREAFGRVYFEAMAAGVPVICSKNTGVHGIFEDGVSGFSADPHDESQLQAIFSKMIRNVELREAVGKAGKELVRGYTWSTVIDMYHTIFENAVAGRRTNPAVVDNALPIN